MELDPKNRGYVDRIAKSAARCHKIVTSLLGFSRQHEPERKPVRINELADAVIEIIAYDVRASNITLVKEYTPDLPLILGDAHQLQQVILNIMSNARQALIDQSEHITIDATEGVGRHNAKSDFVCDDDKRLLGVQRIERYEQLIYLSKSTFIIG